MVTDKPTVPGGRDKAETGPGMFREGFYSILYDGPAGHGIMLVCLAGGRMVGADMGGGVLEGHYRLQDATIVAECIFHFAAGRTLVTGQTLTKDLDQSKRLTIPLQMFEDQRCTVDIGFGPLTARGKFVAAPM